MSLCFHCFKFVTWKPPAYIFTNINSTETLEDALGQLMMFGDILCVIFLDSLFFSLKFRCNK